MCFKQQEQKRAVFNPAGQDRKEEDLLPASSPRCWYVGCAAAFPRAQRARDQTREWHPQQMRRAAEQEDAEEGVREGAGEGASAGYRGNCSQQMRSSVTAILKGRPRVLAFTTIRRSVAARQRS